MKLESVACNNCGASLKVPESANFVTCVHCDTQLAVKRTDNARFTETLDEINKKLDTLTLQNELHALDRAWEQEQEQYKVSTKHGGRVLPNKTGSVIGGVMVVGFGIFWTVMAGSIAGGMGGPASFFPMFGVLFIVIGIGVSIYSFSKADGYERAYRKYQRRRREIYDGRKGE